VTAVILALPAETPQQEADRLLDHWRQKRQRGVPAHQRTLPDDDYHRDLEIIRDCMERKT